MHFSSLKMHIQPVLLKDFYHLLNCDTIKDVSSQRQTAPDIAEGLFFSSHLMKSAAENQFINTYAANIRVYRGARKFSESIITAS